MNKIRAKTIREAISKIKEEKREIIIHIEDPETRPLTTPEEEKKIIKTYYKEVLNNKDLKYKINKIIRKLKREGEVTEEITETACTPAYLLKLSIKEGRIKATINTSKDNTKEEICNIIIFTQIMQEDLALSTGYNTGTIKIRIPK